MVASLLSDLTQEQFYTAIKRFCAEHKEIYPGTNIVPYLREYAFEIDSRMTGEDAWSCFKDYGRGVKQKDKAIYDKTVAAFDSKSFGQSAVADEAIWRAQFIKLFNSFIRRDTMGLVAYE